jgi:hypothetical protein
VHTWPDRSHRGSTLSQMMRAKLRRLRYVGPLVVATACLVAASYVSPLVAYVLLITSFALLFDAGTAWFARAGGTGSLKDFKQ